MSAPFFEYGLISAGFSLVVALIVGIAFGWCLERSGMGSARKLIGQFYLTDLTVFKVMFTAIITAMLGIFWLGWIGFLDISRIYVPETYILPQLVGGIIFGVGFATAGLCPGTSCVSAVTGRGDGVATVLGMLTGVLVSGVFFAVLEPFYQSTPHGSFTLPALIRAPYGVVVFVIVAIALGGFYVAELIEGRERRAAGSGKREAPTLGGE
jgi:uncharacterized membrane protein YedE/YeeE